MAIRKHHMAAFAAALTVAVTLAACGSGQPSPQTSGPATSRPATSATSPATTPATAFNATDVAFTTGVLRLENQAGALAALVPAHTTAPQVRQFAAHLNEHAGEAQRMRDMMGQWGRSAPPPYTSGATPPAGMGPSMMGPGDWEEMAHMHGNDFNDHFADAMIANRTAEIALCRTELRSGTSPQGRELARAMLAERQAELTQLHGWEHLWEHDSDHG